MKEDLRDAKALIFTAIGLLTAPQPLGIIDQEHRRQLCVEKLMLAEQTLSRIQQADINDSVMHGKDENHEGQPKRCIWHCGEPDDGLCSELADGAVFKVFCAYHSLCAEHNQWNAPRYPKLSTLRSQTDETAVPSQQQGDKAEPKSPITIQ